MIEKEEWRDVPGWEGLYQVSSLGRIQSLARKVIRKPASGAMSIKRLPGAVLTPSINDRGYFVVTLSRRGISKTHTLHVLIAFVFIGPRPPGLEVLHGDDDKANNRVTNLRYGTKRMNYEDSVKNGKAKPPGRGTKHHGAKLNESEVAWIRARGNLISHSKLAKMFGVSKTTISSLIKGDSY